MNHCTHGRVRAVNAISPAILANLSTAFESILLDPKGADEWATETFKLGRKRLLDVLEEMRRIADLAPEDAKEAVKNFPLVGIFSKVLETPVGAGEVCPIGTILALDRMIILIGDLEEIGRNVLLKPGADEEVRHAEEVLSEVMREWSLHISLQEVARDVLEAGGYIEISHGPGH